MHATPLKYDLVIVGAGAAGLTAAGAAAAIGVKVALIEKNNTGGECTWFGCVPSKALLRAARAAHEARHSARFGVHVESVRVDFPAVMDYVRSTVREIQSHETLEKLAEDGIDTYINTADFIDAHTLELDDGRRLHAQHIILAVGSVPRQVDGFDGVDYLTPERLFWDMDTQPEHLVIVGGGPIAAEMAQAFVRLGSQVSVISDKQHLLPRDDPDAGRLITAILREEGVQFHFGQRATGATQDADGFTVTRADGSTVRGDRLLVAVGKVPNVTSMTYARAGVAVQAGRFVLNKHLQTTQPHIYVVGDASGSYQFTHFASWQAFQAVRNIYVPLQDTGRREFFAWTTFTEPEVAQAGLTEDAARAQYGDKLHVTRLPMSAADRASTDGETRGFMKLMHLGGGKLLGATIVGYHAGELMNEWMTILERGGRVFNAALYTKIYPTMGAFNAIAATEQLREQFSAGLPRQVVQLLARFSG
jgi:pyruvate/2-oxoglutarate dehydrogenase complex dihydrolipoamide dehydrogenase (E3) component